MITFGTFELSEELKEQLNEEMKIYCDCDEPDEYPYYVKSHKIKGVGTVNHHGWVCHKCNKYIQVG